MVRHWQDYFEDARGVAIDADVYFVVAGAGVGGEGGGKGGEEGDGGGGGWCEILGGGWTGGLGHGGCGYGCRYECFEEIGKSVVFRGESRG